MIYHFGECRLDTARYRVQRGGQRIRLRPKIFHVCLYLLEHRDRVVSRDLSAAADQAAFADGMTAELIAQLAQIPGLGH